MIAASHDSFQAMEGRQGGARAISVGIATSDPMISRALSQVRALTRFLHNKGMHGAMRAYGRM